jgi:hypothetical protein
MATWKSNIAGGTVPNEVFALLEGTHQQFGRRIRITPCAGLVIDLIAGPMVIELPPGPLMGTVNDLNQLWVLDFGLPGPAKAAGGKHLLVPPGYAGSIPEGYFTGSTTTNRVLALVRALPRGTDMHVAVELIKTFKAYPLHPTGSEPEVNLSELVGADFTPIPWEDNLAYWRVLYELIDSEPANEACFQYGELAELGIEKGKPFEPDERMQSILVRAAQMGHAQLCIQSFADRRAERLVWPDRQWEWAVLRPENGTFDAGC